MSKKELNQEKVEAKLLALSLIYEKEESCRQAFLERMSYSPEEMTAVLDGASYHPEFRDWIQSVIPAMQCRDDENGIYVLIDDLKNSIRETHERNKELFAARKRHYKERHAEATSKKTKLTEKLKQVDGFWNKIKVVLKFIPNSFKESIKTVKRQNRELRKIRRAKENKKF